MSNVIKGQIFERLDKDFWSYGAGAMCWGKLNGQEVLYLRVPNERVLLPLHLMHKVGDWGHPGEEQMLWNGNCERPTIRPSIDARKTGGWHGFITHGDLWPQQCGCFPNCPK